MPDALLIWWSALCGAAGLNLAALGFSMRRLSRCAAGMRAGVRATRWQLLSLSALYTLGCGFRSVFPMIDVPRTCLHDPWFARVFVGRSVATLAELAFAAQWALLLREAAGRSRAVALAAYTVFLLIAVAELLSWSAVLRGNYLFHAAENSLWTVAAAIAIAAFASRRPEVDRGARRFLTAAIFCGGAYVAFMSVVDVPMYLLRWQAQAASDSYRTLGDGLNAVLATCVVRREWSAWREDVPWLTLYFTVAVWISLALAHAPPLQRLRN